MPARRAGVNNLRPGAAPAGRIGCGAKINPAFANLAVS